MPRHINEAGLKLLMRSEGCRLTAYKCSAGVDTIGYGHTGVDVKLGMTITQDQANELLIKDVCRFEKGVDDLIRAPISQNAFSACVVLAFNIGLAAFARSTLLRLMNQGDMAGAAKQFGLWTRAAGRTMPGLVVRRQAELNLFRKPDKG